MLCFLIILTVLIVPFSFKVSAKTETDRIILTADFMLFDRLGIKIAKTAITAKKVMSSLFSGKRKNGGLIKTALRYIRIESINITSSLGTGSAASTAILCGQIFAFAAPLAAGKENCSVSLTPVFDKKQFVFSGECIFSFNLANAITAAICAVFKKVKCA